ncbi:hypothetical protein ASD04_00080 [Devosia sp. Root436]|nr:hypothetical protein ASD04_00080 [Devosia sp. Root436]
METYATIVSTFAALGSAGALYLHWIRWKHDQRSKSLIVRVEATAGGWDAINWQHTTLSMRSRSNAGYTAKKIRIWWPPSGRIARHQDLFTVPGDHEWDQKSFKEPANAGRHLETSLTVTHAGQKSAFHPQGHLQTAFGDHEKANFYVKRQGQGRMLLAIDIEPEDDAERPFTRCRTVRF